MVWFGNMKFQKSQLMREVSNSSHRDAYLQFAQLTNQLSSLKMFAFQFQHMQIY